ncbi:MAG: TRAP transporter substrate-binding protein [Proteobacteria bacterium]|nr:TRAP transporter substrate-binding protein [Pseudomonadota bacterium]
MILKSKLVFAALVAALSVGAAHAQQPIVIKFSHVVAEDTPKGKGALKFKELCETRTKGRVKVEVYPNSQLFKDGEEMQMLQLGNVQMLAPSVSKFGPLGAREFEVFDLPYIFDDAKDLHNVTQGKIGQQLFKKLDSKGIIGLAYWDNGFKQMSSNKPLRTPADFRGQKLRIQSSKVLDGSMRALGATPQVMAFSEVYQALQTGVVDGNENTPSNIYTQKMHEVQKYLTMSNHGVVEYAVIVNKKFWEGLPADVRGILEGAMKEATAFTNDIAQKQNDEAMEKMKASGKIQVITLTADEKKAWKKAMLKVHRDNEATIGKEMIQEIYKETGFDPNSL